MSIECSVVVCKNLEVLTEQKGQMLDHSIDILGPRGIPVVPVCFWLMLPEEENLTAAGREGSAGEESD